MKPLTTIVEIILICKLLQIDALSYDFYPLQGMPPTVVSPAQKYLRKATKAATASRISALEIAIRAHVCGHLNTAAKEWH
jgi:hypothetical protein